MKLTELTNFWKWKSLSHVWLFVTPWIIQPMEFSRPEVGSPFFLQGNFPTQGSNPGLLHCRWMHSLPAEPPRDPKNTGLGSLSILQQIFSTWESKRVSCIAGRFFTNWATWEAHEFEQTPGDSEGQGSLACDSPWGCKELDTT